MGGKGLLGGGRRLIAMGVRLGVGGKDMGVRLGGDGNQGRWRPIADCQGADSDSDYSRPLLKLVKEKVGWVLCSRTFTKLSFSIALFDIFRQ